jgi:hypothetical protein
MVELGIEGCRRVVDIDWLDNFPNLQSLNIGNCGDFPSAAPIGQLLKLQTLVAYESTRFVGGDLSGIASLPDLRVLAMANRRQYRPRLAEIQAVAERRVQDDEENANRKVLDWEQYTPLELEYDEPLEMGESDVGERSGGVARRVLRARSLRERQLWRLVKANPFESGGVSTGDIDYLARWLAWAIGVEREVGGGTPERWLGVGLDVGLAVGGALASRVQHLRWGVMSADGPDVTTVKPVLRGFRTMLGGQGYLDVLGIAIAGVNGKWLNNSDWGVNISERMGDWQRREMDG